MINILYIYDTESLLCQCMELFLRSKLSSLICLGLSLTVVEVSLIGVDIAAGPSEGRSPNFAVKSSRLSILGPGPLVARFSLRFCKEVLRQEEPELSAVIKDSFCCRNKSFSFSKCAICESFI